MVISRGQILASITGDNTLRVLCCALCVVCAVGVQCVGVGVCVWCCCWCVTLISTSTLSAPLLSPCVRSKRLPCVHSKRPRVYRHHARKCYHLRASCRYTRGRIETRGFSACHTTPHRTHTPRPQKHTHKRQQQPPQHTETGTERERDRERRKRKCGEDERLEKRRSRDMKREDERRERRQREERR